MYKLRQETIQGRRLYIIRNTTQVHGYGFSTLDTAMAYLTKTLNTKKLSVMCECN